MGDTDVGVVVGAGHAGAWQGQGFAAVNDRSHAAQQGQDSWVGQASGGARQCQIAWPRLGSATTYPGVGAQHGPRVGSATSRQGLEGQGRGGSWDGDGAQRSFMLVKKEFNNSSQSGNRVTKPNQWKFILGTSPTSWKDVCNFDRNLEEDRKVSYVPPCAYDSVDFFAKIDKLGIEANVQK